MMLNGSLIKARRVKQDEFYTQMSDIERELEHYTKYFEGSRVLCNCDDPFVSNFTRYFVINFNRLKLRSITSTCYKNCDPDLFTQNTNKHGVKLVYEGGEYHSISDMNKMQCVPLEGDGDFRSDEVLKLLDESDIVVTNPPFSLFRKYIATLIEHNKRFLVIGNQNAITYKEIFPLIKSNRLWLGIHNGDKSFRVPSYYEERSTRFWQDSSGQKWRSLGNTCWYTNLWHNKRRDMLETGIKYDASLYSHYDNYDAIEVPKTMLIPMDYTGVMGVPITFLDRYNPDQFDIVGDSRYHDGQTFPDDINVVNGKLTYKRILIRKKK